MKKEYNFSASERGKFYRRNTQINLPIYLDTENLNFVEQIAKKRKKDISFVVNEFIKGDRKISKVIGE